MADAYAIGRTDTAEFHVSDLRREFDGDPQVENHVRGQLLEIAAAVAGLHHDAVAVSLAQALPRRLLAQALSAGECWKKEGAEVELHVLQADLAEMLGTTRAKIGFELKRLEKAGAVRRGYRTVFVHDMTKLCAASGTGVVPL
jgi:CRP-like cAMP-binding protein